MSSSLSKTQKRIEHIGLKMAMNNPELAFELPDPMELSLGLTSSSQQDQQNEDHHHNHHPTLDDLALPGLPQTTAIRTTPAHGLIRDKIRRNFPNNQFFINPDDKPIITDKPTNELFEEIDHLGYGSGGQVVKMKHRQTGIICAVKQMRMCDNDNDKRIEMDLQVILACKYEHIVRCYGYFIENSDVWICMEPMTTCLHKLFKAHNRPFPETFLGAIACAAIKALNYLKENHGIMHRDIKPSNILINEEDGKIKLCDFGVSGRLINSMARTRPAGCWSYLAPERFNTDLGEYDIRADVWSLGVTLFELATAQSYPMNCEVANPMAVLTAITKGPPPQLPDDMQFSDQFRQFMSKCLIKDHTKRPKYKQLLEDDFIKMHMNTVVNLSDYVNPKN